ncbi:MAG: histone deacetylase family protein [Granulosicoccaceae bacterium]
MQVIYSPDHALHHPQAFLTSGVLRQSPEVPTRGDVLLASARDAGHEIRAPKALGIEPAASIHPPSYIHFLEHIHRRWRALPNASEEVIPNVHPLRRSNSYPSSPIGQAGFHLGDTACPVGAGTYTAALAATHCAATAADLVLANHSVAYALCRPPGHHAAQDVAGGFCFFNNSAIAAQRLRQTHSRVAIVDVDLHHGNGTQNIFYHRDDILTASLHADPHAIYPFFWGHAHERGEDAGIGYNINAPLPVGSADQAFIAALESILEQVLAFSPGALVVALGLDASEHDPFGGLSLSTEGFAKVSQLLADLALPTVLVQEGGYLCDALGDNLQAALSAFK